MQTVVIIAAVAVVLMALLGVFSMIRQYLRAMAQTTREAYIPPAYYRPPSVTPTVGLTITAAVALVWGSMHLAGASWALTWVNPAPEVYFAAAAVGILAAMLLAGAGLLLASNGWGRRLAVYATFLMGILAVAGAGVALVLPYQYSIELPPQVTRAAPWVALVLAIHLLVDAALGTAAQHAGRPIDAAAPKAPLVLGM